MFSSLALQIIHVRALAAAVTCRHFRWQALLVRILRACLPAALLMALYQLRKFLLAVLRNKEFLLNLGVKRKDVETLYMQMGLFGAEAYFTGIVDDIFIVALLFMSMLLTVVYLQHITREFESGLRQLLHIMGLSRYAYWIVTTCLEGMLQLNLELSVLLLVSRFGLGVRVARDTSLVLLLLCLIPLTASVICLGSLLSFVFRSSKTSIIAVIVLGFVISLVSIVFSTWYGYMDKDLMELRHTKFRFVLACPTVPAYHAFSLLVSSCFRDSCMTFGTVSEAWQYEWTVRSPLQLARALLGAGTKRRSKGSAAAQLIEVVELTVMELVVCVIILILLDMRAMQQLNRSTSRNDKLLDADTMLEVQGVKHGYGWLPGLPPQELALNGVSFVMRPGATLGLLGPNGAGKTTVIKCITGQEVPHEGKVVFRRVHQAYGGDAQIGLCPQETTLIDDLTVREQLQFFSRIKGVPCDQCSASVEKCIAATNLDDKRYSFPPQLSGGMRRRLSIGCALVGAPALTFLDEPTTGLDPISRRSVWTSIAGAKDNGSCLLITTHMLEEAEELCSHIVILMKGLVATQGSVQELKDVWGTGYNMSVDAKLGEVETAKSYIASLLPAENKEPVKISTSGQMVFKVGKDAEFVGQLFLTMARTAEANNIRHWGISQASLEDAYVRIVAGE